MGWLGDNVVLGQKPRKNGCICTLAILALLPGLAWLLRRSTSR